MPHIQYHAMTNGLGQNYRIRVYGQNGDRNGYSQNSDKPEQHLQF